MRYEATVTVQYHFEVEADDEQQAEQIANDTYHNHAYFADVYSIDLEELEDDDVL